MAYMVFGAPITNETLKVLPPYDREKELTAEHRSKVARDWEKAERKYEYATDFSKKLREAANLKDKTNGVECLIYNATGGVLTLNTHANWGGRVGSTPYPRRIENGQNGVFFIEQDGDNNIDFSGCVTYFSKSRAYWCIGWTNSNQCHAMAKQDVFTREEYDTFSEDLKNNTHYKDSESEHIKVQCGILDSRLEARLFII